MLRNQAKVPVIKRIRISQKKFRLIVKCFCLDITASVTGKLSLLNRNTVNKYYAVCKYVVCHAAIKERHAQGLANGVEIDEAYFGARRIRGKRGRGASGKIIVLGLLKRNGRVYADIIPDVQRKTLLPIIRRVVHSGSDIYTDGWRSYDALAVYGYNHKTVKHDENEFARGDTHVNGIESYWSWTKRRAIKFNGIKKNEFSQFLLESEWRFNHRDTIEKDVRSLLKQFRKNSS
jgi:transposase